MNRSTNDSFECDHLNRAVVDGAHLNEGIQDVGVQFLANQVRCRSGMTTFMSGVQEAGTGAI